MSDHDHVAKLILGPLLRGVSDGRAVLWLQTDSPARVTIRAGDQVTEAETFIAHGVNLCLPVLDDLSPGRTEYAVELDGEPVWPLPGSPPSAITIRTDGDATIAFGSCRDDLPHPDPDALVAYARRAMQGGAPLPDALAMIGDQIYADKVWTFAEYVALYHHAWTEPHVRWLLSTVPTYMIFDDHEIHDDWNSSTAWLAQMQARPGWDEHLAAGIESYWLFQHLGNLPAGTDVAKPPSDWGFTVDIGRTRLIMLDCRGSRMLADRRMFPQEQWDRLRRDAAADCDHLVFASSLPWLLAPTIHHGEAIMEVLSTRFDRMETLRRHYDLEHWAAVGHSFEELTDVIRDVERPATISVLGGDVHHSYVAKVDGSRPIHQITCSPFNNHVRGKMRLLLQLGWWRSLAAPARLAARLFGIPRPRVRWKPLTKPYFGNAIATLTHHGRTASVLIEGTRPDGTLERVSAVDLTPPARNEGHRAP